MTSHGKLRDVTCHLRASKNQFRNFTSHQLWSTVIIQFKLINKLICGMRHQKKPNIILSLGAETQSSAVGLNTRDLEVLHKPREGPRLTIFKEILPSLCLAISLKLEFTFQLNVKCIPDSGNRFFGTSFIQMPVITATQEDFRCST